jgi:hypothetical protein
MKEKNINELMQEILKFLGRRDWAQFHDPKNCRGFKRDGKSNNERLGTNVL